MEAGWVQFCEASASRTALSICPGFGGYGCNSGCCVAEHCVAEYCEPEHCEPQSPGSGCCSAESAEPKSCRARRCGQRFDTGSGNGWHGIERSGKQRAAATPRERYGSAEHACG
jgi:hypothetical protein